VLRAEFEKAPLLRRRQNALGDSKGKVLVKFRHRLLFFTGGDFMVHGPSPFLPNVLFAGTDQGVRVPAAEVARLLTEQSGRTPIAHASQRNRFPGVITEVKKDKLAATVEIQAGPHRVLSFITREAADQMGLKAGMQAVAAVKATNVTIELPG